MDIRHVLGIGALALGSLLAGCSANHKSIYRHQEMAPGSTITLTDAKQRAILSTGDAKGEKNRRFCAEPSPDVFAVIAQSLSVGGTFGQQADPKAIQAALSAAFASSEQASTIPRTQTINMLRELMYRTCERYLNGGITSLELPLQAIRDQRLMVSILAIEQLTGAVATKAVALGAAAEAQAGASAAGGMATLERARNERNKRNDELAQATEAFDKAKVKVKDKDESACALIRDGRADEAGTALTDAIKTDCGDKQKQLEAAQAKQKEAQGYYDQQVKLAASGSIPASAGATVSAPTAVGGIDKAGGGNVGEVASTVRAIVDMNFTQDEYMFLCLKLLSPEQPMNPHLETSRKSCETYLNRAIEAEAEREALKANERKLEQQRLATEMNRLQAASSDQFETFWKTISNEAGTAIDAAKFDRVKAKAAGVVTWPACFTAAGTKAETRKCFLDRLVPFQRDTLIDAATAR